MKSISSFKIKQTIQALNQGQIIAYPTEAVYGLGCDPLNETAVMSLLDLKQRSVEKGLILIASQLSQLAPYLQLDETRLKRISHTWPGAVTWVIPCQDWVPHWLTGNRNTLAVRVSAHPLVKALCDAYGQPLVSTSANLSKQQPAVNSLQVRKRLAGYPITLVHGQVGKLKQVTPIYDVTDGRCFR